MKWHLLRDFLYLRFVMYYSHHPLVNHSTKMNIYIASQSENGISCLTVIENKRLLTRPYGGRNCEQHSLQAGILMNCDE
jgi:hypothetical protein